MSKELRAIFEQSRPARAERRHGLDLRGKFGLVLATVAWVLWGIGLYLTNFAFPQMVTYFDTLYNKSPDLSYDPEFLIAAEIFWIFGAMICLLSILQYRKRNRRRGDKPHYGILAALVFNALSFFGFAIYLVVEGFI